MRLAILCPNHISVLDLAGELLEQGELFGIYPEGTRSRDGLLHKGGTGAARLAMRTGVPIIPVGIRGTDEIMPPDARVPRPFRRASVAFGPPIEPDRDATLGWDERAALRRMTDDLMAAIRSLGSGLCEYLCVGWGDAPRPDAGGAPPVAAGDPSPQVTPLSC